MTSFGCRVPRKICRLLANSNITVYCADGKTRLVVHFLETGEELGFQIFYSGCSDVQELITTNVSVRKLR